MASKATKTASGMWRARANAYVDGQRVQKSFTASTKKQAEYLAAQFEVSGKAVVRTGPMTVDEAVDSYIDARSAVLSPSTVRSYRQIKRCYYGPIVHRRLADLKPEEIQRLVNLWATEVSPKTVRNAYTLLTSVLKKYRPEFSPDTDLPKKIRHEIEIPEKDDVARMLDAAQGTALENAILLGAVCGLRRGEICALTFGDIDTSNQDKPTLTVTKAYAQDDHSRWVLKAPKSYAGTRTIGIPPALVQRLRANAGPARPRKRDKGVPYLITPTTRVYPRSCNTLTMDFHNLCTKLGITCRFHDLRHYNASTMLAINMPDKYAMERLGQSTPGLIKSVYQHIMRDKRAETTDALNDEMTRSLLGGKCDANCDAKEKNTR